MIDQTDIPVESFYQHLKLTKDIDILSYTDIH